MEETSFQFAPESAQEP